MKFFILLLPLLMFGEELKLEHDKYGFDKKCDLILKRDSYINCYSYENKGPKYIAYNTADFFQDQKIINEKFILEEDLDIDKKYRTETIDYSKANIYYPTKLISTLSASSTMKAKEESYLLSATVPMNNATFELWSKIDKLEASYVEKYKQLNIYSGAIYTKKYIGNEVKIPFLFYKIFYAPNANKILAFLIPHKENFEEKNVFKYNVTVDKIEEYTGINFFNNIDKSNQDLLEGKIPFF